MDRQKTERWTERWTDGQPSAKSRKREAERSRQYQRAFEAASTAGYEDVALEAAAQGRPLKWWPAAPPTPTNTSQHQPTPTNTGQHRPTPTNTNQPQPNPTKPNQHRPTPTNQPTYRPTSRPTPTNHLGSTQPTNQLLRLEYIAQMPVLFRPRSHSTPATTTNRPTNASVACG